MNLVSGTDPRSLSNVRILLSSQSSRKVTDVHAIRSSKPQLSRTHLKRPIPSFSVEIRRHPGRTTGPGLNARFFETKAALSEFDRDSHRAADAIFAPRSEVAASMMASTPAPTGRVLPVLVIDQPSNTEPNNEFSAAANPERGSRAADRPTPRSRNGGASPPKSRNRTAPSPKVQPSIASNRSVSAVDVSPTPRPDDGAKLSTRKRPSKGSGNAKRASAQPRHAPAPPSNNKPSALMEHRPTPLSEDRHPASVVADLQVAPSKVNGASSRIHNRIIWGRYVTGDEPKPGERWRSRLRDRH